MKCSTGGVHTNHLCLALIPEAGRYSVRAVGIALKAALRCDVRNGSALRVRRPPGLGDVGFKGV